MLLAVAAACGGSGGGGNTQLPQTTLRVTTIGDGLVRGGSDGGDCRGTCATLTPMGSQVRLQAIPDPGATFVGWTGACNGTGPCQLTVDHETAVTATFDSHPPPLGFHHLTVVVDGSGHVVSTPAGLDCDSTTCSADFTDGGTVTVNATPAAGFVFDGWTAGPCTGTSACAITLKDDQQLTARFTKHPPQQIHIAVAVSGPGQVQGGGIDCGLPPSAVCDTTVVPGSTTTLTAFPGNLSRFMGWGGACSGTAPTCSVVANADTQVTAAFEFEMQTVVPNDGTNMPVLALNSTHVFFGRRTADGASAIWSVPKTGGTPTQVAGGLPKYIVADDGFVYWTDGTGIYSAPVAGGTASQLTTSSSADRLALDERGALYWVDAGDKGFVHRMENRIGVPITAEQAPSGAIAVDTAFVYFGNAGEASANGGAILRVPRTGGSVQPVAVTAAPVVAIRLDPQNVYYRDTSGAVFSMAKSGGAPLLLSAPNSGIVSGPLDLDVNAGVVWWTWMDSTGAATKGLFHANADGSGFTPVETGSDLTVWSGPRVDDTAVYYFHAGALLKRLK
ncbi:MAG: InlB B-repeat-containing protein [Myxococcales bacterium]